MPWQPLAYTTGQRLLARGITVLASAAGMAMTRRCAPTWTAVLRTRAVGAGLVAAALAAFCESGNAATPSAATEVTVGPVALVTGDLYYPYSVLDENRRGAVLAVVQASLAAAGVPHAVQIMPWARGEAAVVAIKADATFPYIKTKEREQRFLYSDPIASIQTALFVRADDGWRPQTAADFKGRRICAPSGYALDAPVQAIVDAGLLKRDSPSNTESCFRMLKAKRADLVGENEPLGWSVVTKLYGAAAGFRVAPFPLPPQTLHLIVSRRNPRAQLIITAFNRGLAQLDASGRGRTLLEGQSDAPAGPRDN